MQVAVLALQHCPVLEEADNLQSSRVARFTTPCDAYAVPSGPTAASHPAQSSTSSHSQSHGSLANAALLQKVSCMLLAMLAEQSPRKFHCYG